MHHLNLLPYKNIAWRAKDTKDKQDKTIIPPLMATTFQSFTPAGYFMQAGGKKAFLLA